MNSEDITRMAQEVGMEFRENVDEFNTAYCDGVHRDELERFAALVAAAERKRLEATAWGASKKWIVEAVAAEREACAKLADKYMERRTADAIRARGQS